VLADPAVLATLPVRERRAAFGELVKYAVLDGEELYEMVERLARAMASDADIADMELLTEVIRRCAGIKSWIVTRDEREQTGERALLNLGHTVGHAIEKAAGYGQLLHGEAVALGMVAATRLSAALGLCPPELEARVSGTLRSAGLDVHVDSWLREDVLRHIGVDKKRSGKEIAFVTISGVGQCGVTSIALDELTTRLCRAHLP
jgi:3-dehydroquinate synthetase